MTPLPLTLCLYTSTKGHFGRDTYRDTVNDLLRQLPVGWGGLHANVKWEPGEETKRDEMASWLEGRGFKVTTACQSWRHFEASHQEGYLSDIKLVSGVVKTPYLLHMEDDFLLRSVRGIGECLAAAVQCLEVDTSILQVRFARWANEATRIEGLKAKHGIDAEVIRTPNGGFWHSDWSNNPFVARTRDIHAALSFLFASNLPRHSEHGFSVAMKLLAHHNTPFYTFNPDLIYCRHIGTMPGEEDPLDKPMYAN